jgi:hypothetical protein
VAEEVTPGSENAKKGFEWSLQGRITAVDNGASLASRPGFPGYMKLGTFSVVSFDPGGVLGKRKDLEAIEELQIVPAMTLGNGQSATFTACLDAALSSTLEPLPGSLAATVGPANLGVGPILTRVPVSTLRLDDIPDLPAVEWLVLDSLNNNAAILENGTRVLSDTLIVEIQIPFQPTHAGQLEFGAVNQWMAAHGLRFCRFQGFTIKTRFPTDRYLERTHSSDMRAATALFIPSEDRLGALSGSQLQKLSFLLHTIYKLPDLTYHVLAQMDPAVGERYLIAEGYLWPVDEDEASFILTEAYSPDIWKR